LLFFVNISRVLTKSSTHSELHAEREKPSKKKTSNERARAKTIQKKSAFSKRREKKFCFVAGHEGKIQGLAEKKKKKKKKIFSFENY
jgi:hypothetical protein